ncbi:MAG: TetR/AcrR family transcriptional regulator [Eubacteriaceae bacterium]|nr:TetR/AcrR family transcriptional regulator [Eubacteriaceae bacterium]
MDNNNENQSTRTQIFNAAKVEFYDNGYSKGTLVNIAKRSGTPQALINYYYNTKKQLAEAIFADFTQRIYDLIGIYPHLAMLDNLSKHFIYSHIFYGLVFPNAAEKRFFKECYEKKVEYSPAGTLRRSQEIYISGNENAISPLETRILMSLQTACRNDFTSTVFADGLDFSSPAIINMMEAAVARLFYISETRINKAIVTTLSNIGAIDTSGISLLV